MPGKPRKKVSTQKDASKTQKPDKLDQILLRLDRIDEHLSEHDKRFDAHDKRFDGLQNELHGEIAKFREENRKEHEHDRNMMLKLHDEQTRRTDKLQGDFDEFRDFVYTNLDAVRGEYDTSRQERMFTGAAQDRQQKEIDSLKQSDEMQNGALVKIEHRVTQLELNQAA